MCRREWLWKPDKERKRKDFFELVRKVLNGKDDGALNKERVRRMAGRARAYIIAYLKIEEAEAAGGDSGAGEKGISSNTYEMIEKMVKSYKTHRSALDFDLKFIQKLEATAAPAAPPNPPEPPDQPDDSNSSSTE